MAGKRPTWMRYAAAVAAVAAALILCARIASTPGDAAPLLILTLTVVLAASFGGLGPGLLATAIGAVGGALVFAGGMEAVVREPDTALIFGLFLVVGTLLSALMPPLRAHRTRELEGDLQQRIADFETLLRVIPVGIAVASDRECRDIRVNPSFASALGLPVNANASKTAAESDRPTNFRVFDDLGREVPDDQLPMQIAAREGREIRGAELNVVHDDGRVVRLLEYAAPLLDASGEPRGSVGAFVDVTERRRLEQRAHAVLESITDAFYLLDHEWRFLYVNQRALDYYGKTREELVGQVVWDVFPQARGARFHQECERAVRERISVGFEFLSPVTGRWIEVHAYPSVEGLSVYFQDVTNRKRAQTRDKFLLQLDDETRTMADPSVITEAAARMLGEHLAASRCAYAQADPDEQGFEIIGDYCRGVPSIRGRYTVASFGQEFERLTRAGEPFVVSNTDSDPRTSPTRRAYRQAHIGALVNVPLLKGGRFAGGMAVHQDRPREWRTDEIQLVRMVANRCWESIERAKLTRGLFRRTRSLRVLADNATRLLSEEDPQAIIESLFNEAGSLLELDLCFHGVVSEDGSRLRLAVCRGLDDEACSRLEALLPAQALCGAAPVDRQPVVFPSAGEQTGPETEWVRSLGVRVYACFPLVSGDRLFGLLSFGSRQREAFDDDEVELLRAISDQVSAAYARARTAGALKESEDRLVQAIAIAGLGTFETDLRTDAMIVNAPGREIYGWSEADTPTFTGVQKHFHPEDREWVLAVLRDALRPGGPGVFEVEHRIVRQDGAVRWIRVRGYARFERMDDRPVPVRCLGTYLDVTERREAEDRRKDLLAKEQTARAEAERVIRMKDEFLATLSHELRTPLNAILGWSQLLRRGAIPQSETPGALETIDRNARAQAQLIDDLLDMSRIVSGNIRLEMRPLDLEPVVTAAIKSIEPAASAKGIHLEQTLEALNGRVAGDPVRLQQVFWNLLSNAVKFTPPGGHVRVSLVRRGATLEVAVSDTGAGIAPQFFPDLFQRFRQQDASTTRRHGGLGLGLSIARHLLELHGGSVHASSPGEGQGATFVVTLPALSAQAREVSAPRQLHSAGTDAPPGADPVSLAGVRILAVDDEPDARELIGRILESAGAIVAVVDSAEAALEWIARHPIDLLVSDIGMPQVDGYDLIRRVRRLHDPGASVPAIALTAYAGPEDCERALLAGYQAHVPKPLELSTLVTAVAEVLLRAGGPEKSRRPEDVVPLE